MNSESLLNLPSCATNLNKFGHIFDKSIFECLSPKLHDVLKGKKIIFTKNDKSLVPIDGWGSKSTPYCTATITTIQPIKEDTMISAIDSSSIQIAETEEGSLYAVKSGITIAINGCELMHFKIGPVLFYLNEETIRYSALDHRLTKLVLFDNDLAKRLIRIRVERAIQMELSRQFSKSIILIDGSLKSSIFESKNQSIKNVAENCSLYRNSIIGISKASKLKVLDRVSLPLTKIQGPAYMDIDLIIQSLVRNTIGNNLMVKLGNNSIPVLRADIVATHGDKDESLGKLLGNDSIIQGYPETLRLAHHISTFTSTETSCLRGHVLSNYDVTEIASEDIRKTLLGSIPV